MIKSSFNRILSTLLVIISSLATSVTVYAAQTTETVIFDPSFRTLRIYNPDNFMSLPLLRLGTEDRLVVSFDEIGDERSYLRARLMLCDADWKPSRLAEPEYADGFNYTDIEDYGFSSNTFVHYVNYHVELPSPELQPLVSGNYLLQVYDRDEPDDVLLQVRFYVSDEAARVGAQVTSRTDRGTDDFWQQLSVSALTDGLDPNANPYADLKLAVMQNRRPETLRFVQKPLRSSGNNTVWEHDPSLIFAASNEYRRFENTHITTPGMHSDSIRFGGSNYHIYLSPDVVRDERQYSFDRTQKGRFIVREQNSTDSDLGADYVTVHFTLDSPKIYDGEVYVDGDMTYNRFTDSNRMLYDAGNGVYRLELPLKQGAYNYQYVVLRDGSSFPDSSVIEGNKYETLNEYDILLYFTPPGARHDRLVGAYSLILN